jgi:hypothetical protein
MATSRARVAVVAAVLAVAVLVAGLAWRFIGPDRPSVPVSANPTTTSASGAPGAPGRALPPTAGGTPSSAPPNGAASVRVVVAADLACTPGAEPEARDCQQEATHQVAARLQPDAVLLAGDLQYEHGTAEEFAGAFDRSWGRMRSIIHPAAGNHEYDTGRGAAYFDFFGAAAGRRDQGWYSLELGAWHVIALNSNCDEVGGCGEGSAQLAWLRADLAEHRNRCVMAFWHHPRWSHAEHGDHAELGPFMTALYDAGAEAVMVGHDHDYQRFEPRSPDGARDPERGIRQFVVGMGGRSLYSIDSTEGLEAHDDDTFGVLSMTLGPDGYDWEFVPAAGGSYHDRGSAVCH